MKPDEALGPSNPEGGAPGNRTKLNGKQLAAALRTAARALVEDPEYLEARSRRIDDGKAPRLRRLLWELADQKSREPEAFRPRKLPFCFISDYLPWDPARDNMREQMDRMIAAKAREEEEARAREAARDRPAPPTPEEPDPDDWKSTGIRPTRNRTTQTGEVHLQQSARRTRNRRDEDHDGGPVLKEAGDQRGPKYLKSRRRKVKRSRRGQQAGRRRGRHSRESVGPQRTPVGQEPVRARSGPLGAAPLRPQEGSMDHQDDGRDHDLGIVPPQEPDRPEPPDAPAAAPTRKQRPGPKTPQGKARVRHNPTRFGIHSADPVIPGIESLDEWRVHREGVIASLAPVGSLETKLAERVALLLWRLNRVIAYEQAEYARANEGHDFRLPVGNELDKIMRYPPEPPALPGQARARSAPEAAARRGHAAGPPGGAGNVRAVERAQQPEHQHRVATGERPPRAALRG